MHIRKVFFRVFFYEEWKSRVFLCTIFRYLSVTFLRAMIVERIENANSTTGEKKPAEESATHYELTNCWINFCLGCFRYPTSLWHIQIVRLPKLCVFALIDSSRLHIKLKLDVMRRIFMTLFSSLHTSTCMMHLGMTTKKTNPQRLNWKCGKQYATSRH